MKKSSNCNNTWKNILMQRSKNASTLWIWIAALIRCGKPCGDWVTVLKKSLRATEQDREDVVQQRLDWCQCQESVDPQRLVFVDETGLKTDMHRLRGWAQQGQRLVEAVVVARFGAP